MIKRLAGYLLVFCSVAWAQPEPVPLRVTRIIGISTTTVIDNRNAVTRQNDMHTFCATGSGTWSVKIQYSNTSSSGPWSDFTNSFATVSDASSACTGLAYGNHSWIRFLVTGTASATYSGVKQFYIPTEFLSSGSVLSSLNGLTASSQTFATGTSGTDFAISSSSSTHTFNLPTATSSARGALSAADWSTFNSKQGALTNSAGLRGALSDETGSGLAVFNTAPALDLPQFNVYSIGGTLPAAGTANRIALITNGLTVDDCTVGGGSVWLLCVDTGSTWVHPGGSQATGAAGGALSGTYPNPSFAGASGSNTVVKFGSNDAVYVTRSNPAACMNAYYDSVDARWEFGDASPENYASCITRDGSGNLLLSVSTGTGAANSAITWKTITLAATGKLSGLTPGTSSGEVVALNGSNQVDIALIPTGTSSSTVALGDHTHSGVYEPANANIQSHISSTSNPHSVTKAQVGLGNVDDYATASQAEAEAGLATDKFMTPQRVKQSVAALETTVASNTTAIADRVVGPASATNRALAAFSGTTGKAVQNSACVFTDASLNKLSCPGGFVGGDGSTITYVKLPELSANGSNYFAVVGAPSQAADACIEIDGGPAAGALLQATSTTNSRTVDGVSISCRLMRWVTIPDCDDSGGNHVNYDTATGDFSCGTSSSVSGGSSGLSEGMAMWRYNNSNTLQAVGLSISETGSVGSANPTDTWPRGVATKSTSTTIDTCAGWRSTALQFRAVTGNTMSFHTAVGIDNTTNKRLWIGWSNEGGFVTACGSDDPTSLRFMGFRAAAGDTNFQCYASNASASTIVDSGVAVTTSRYTFEVVYTRGTGATYKINGNPVCVGMASTNFPSNGTNIGWTAIVRNTAAEAKVISLEFANFQ